MPQKVKQQPQKTDPKREQEAAKDLTPQPAATPAVNPAVQLAKVPQLANLGKVICSSKPVPLTETETEYTVTCVKHIFPEHLVLQVSFFYF